jgi:SAM-dependent methyltransferase
MMFGFRDRFQYFECSLCGCLQLVDPPADLSRYYPRDLYYSFNEPLPRASELTPPSLRERTKNHIRLFGRRGLYRLLPEPSHDQQIAELSPYVSDLHRRQLRARILDVGCGEGGWILSRLRRLGFNRLTGVDPGLNSDRSPVPGMTIHGCTIESLKDSKFDYIIFNHSLEHMAHQVEPLAAARRLLARRAVCRVEVPVIDCAAWREYGTDWIEIDAPRHFFLHTPRSLRIVAKRSGLEVYRELRVGTSLEFWGSELYRRGLTLFDWETRKYRGPRSVFTGPEAEAFERKSESTNLAGTGGRVAFYLRPARGGGA